jgi:hypothetical protein
MSRTARYTDNPRKRAKKAKAKTSTRVGKAASACREADCVFMYEPGPKDRTIGVWIHYETEEEAQDNVENAIAMGVNIAKATGTVLSPSSLKDRTRKTKTMGTVVVKRGIDKFVFGDKIRLRFAADSNAKIQKIPAEFNKAVKDLNLEVIFAPTKERVYRGIAGPAAPKAPKARKARKASKAPKARKARETAAPKAPRAPKARKAAPKARKAAPAAPPPPKVTKRADGVFLHGNTVEVVSGGKITWTKSYDTPAKAASSARMAAMRARVPVTKANPRQYGYGALPGRSYYQPRTLTSGMGHRRNRSSRKGYRRSR